MPGMGANRAVSDTSCTLDVRLFPYLDRRLAEKPYRLTHCKLVPCRNLHMNPPYEPDKCKDQMNYLPIAPVRIGSCAWSFISIAQGRSSPLPLNPLALPWHEGPWSSADILPQDMCAASAFDVTFILEPLMYTLWGFRFSCV